MEDYNTLLDRFDAVVIENEALKDEIKELKEIINNHINLGNKGGLNA